MQRQLRVFLCHSSQDKPSVRDLYTLLKSQGWIDPWLDEEKLLPGQDYTIEIQKATQKADVIIICLSKKSVLREGYVNREIRHALDIAEEKREGEIFVIPLRFDECDPSFAQLKKLHWVDYFKESASDKLLESLRTRATSLEINPSEKNIISAGKKINFNMSWIIAGLLILLVTAYFSLRTYFNKPDNTPTATANTNTSEDITATSPSFTPTPDVPLSTPTPGIGSTLTGKDGMVLMYVPAGEFLMGNDDKESDERPEHQVYLDAFWIDKTEVTNAMYEKCVVENECDPPVKLSSKTQSNYYGNSEFGDYPVNYISWQMAKNYCLWAGRDLPTEAQWEKASRGDDGAEFPWGNARISPSLLNYQESGIGDTTRVGTYPDGASPYGVLDISGNVYEWVNDWYDAGYYMISPSANPSGPSSGQYRVARGGAWGFASDYARSSYRNFFAPEKEYNFGFRCALSE